MPPNSSSIPGQPNILLFPHLLISTEYPPFPTLTNLNGISSFPTFTNLNPAGLYRGYAAFLLRDLPFDAIEFVAYEQLKLSYMAVAGVASAGGLGGLETAAVGALAGGITGALTTPLDTGLCHATECSGSNELQILGLE
jgi:hypothetical protein